MQPLDNATCARLAQFEVLTAEWQLAAVRFPQWVKEPGRKPYRLFAAIACCLESEHLGRGDVARSPGLLAPGLVMSLLALATYPDMEYLPSLILMRDAELLEQLRPDLEPLGIQMRLAESLPLIEAFERNMRRDFADPLEG